MASNVLGPKTEMRMLAYERADDASWLVLYKENRAVELRPTGGRTLKLFEKIRDKSPKALYQCAQLDARPKVEPFTIDNLITADRRPIGSLTFEFTYQITPEGANAIDLLLRRINSDGDAFGERLVGEIIQSIKNHIRHNASQIDAMKLQFDSEIALVDGEEGAFSRPEIKISGIKKTGGDYFAAKVVAEMTKLRDAADSIETIMGTRDLEAHNAKHSIAIKDELDRTQHAVDRARELDLQREQRDDEIKRQEQEREDEIKRQEQQRGDQLVSQQHEEEMARRDQVHRINMAKIAMSHEREMRNLYIEGVLDEARMLGVDPFIIAHRDQWAILINANKSMVEELIRQLGSGYISNDQVAAVIDYMRNPADVLPRERKFAARIVDEIDPGWKPSSQSTRRRTEMPGLIVNQDIAQAWWRAGGETRDLTGASIWDGGKASAVLIVGKPKPVAPATFEYRLAELSELSGPIVSEIVEGRTVREVIVAFTRMLARDRSEDIGVEVRHRVLEKELVVELTGASEDVRSLLDEITSAEVPCVPLLEGLVDPPVRVRFLPAEDPE